MRAHQRVGARSRTEDVDAAEAAPVVGKTTLVERELGGVHWEPIDPEEYAELDVASFAGDVAKHAATERDAPPPTPRTAHARRRNPVPSRGRAGRAVNINLAGMLEGTKLTPALVRLVRVATRDGLRITDRPNGIAKLEVVFAHPPNAPRLRALTHNPNPTAWLNAHVTAVIPTRETQGATAVLRSTGEVARAVVRFLKGHPGSKVLIDEAGQGRFALVRDVARMLSQRQPAPALLAELGVTEVEYRQLRGRWGAYISAAPGGIQNSRPLRGTLQALRGAGAGAVLEGYKFGVNDYDERDERLREARHSLALLRPYIARASLALGVDPKRLGVDEAAGTVDGRRVGGGRAQLRRIFRARLRRVLAEARRMVPGVDLGTWVSRMEGNAAEDDAELRALFG